MEYAGKLPYHDPVYGFLCNVLPQLSHDQIHNPSFSVYRLHGSNHVFLYREERSSVELIGKFFFGTACRPYEKALRLLEHEWNALQKMRSLGFTTPPHQVVRPLSYHPDCNCLLIEEYSRGISLNYYIQRVLIHKGHGLYDRLRQLASFLARWHNHTALDHRVAFDHECLYFQHLIERVRQFGGTNEQDLQALLQRLEEWRHRGMMWEDRAVFVHGDPTPMNILFGKGDSVIAIDLERCKYTDRAFDLGRVVAELQHHFMLHTKDPSAAEPFIGHFLWEYARHFPNQEAAFRSITTRLPFYIGLTLLRIIPNSWISKGQRRRLLTQAFLNLQGPYHGH